MSKNHIINKIINNMEVNSDPSEVLNPQSINVGIKADTVVVANITERKLLSNKLRIGMRGGSNTKKKLRPSPSTSATIYAVGTKKTGSDGNVWIVAENINGVKRWKLHKVPSKIKGDTKKKSKSKQKTKSKTRSSSKEGVRSKSKKKKLSALDLYDVVHVDTTEFRNIVNGSSNRVRKTLEGLGKVFSELSKLPKLTHIIPLPISSGGVYWMDYPGDYLSNIYGDDWYNREGGYLYATVCMNVTGTSIEEDREISISYSHMDASQKKKVINAFEKYLKGQYKWTGRNTERIFVPYERQKTKPIDLSSLKDDDEYPMLMITIDLPKKDMTMDDVGKLAVKTSDALSEIIKSCGADLYIMEEYGIRDIFLEINGISTEIYDKCIKKIEKYLTKKQNDGVFEKYRSEMYISPDKMYP
ncbi:hypothetical protein YASMINEVIRUS_488 [Yasminevirus sp. GU-2018]|uniref:Uncharacterized protein n=1 Tax=Yasminevirus sp. GU-2018 TaxID=2420051 RepID=A0A5K0U887_9VIRU|nr:hypothetical protein YASMINEVIRUS_488 [Yasminevirus sp. GU-2018]